MPDPADSQAHNAPERVIYAYPPGSASPNDDIDLREIWSALVRDRWVVIVLSLLGLAGAGIYASLAPTWYRAEVLLLPEPLGGWSPLGAQPSQSGELAALAKITLGRDMKSGALAFVHSHDFMRDFLAAEGLVDAVNSLTGAGPDVEAAVGSFMGRLSSIREEQQTGAIVLGVDWKDAATAASVANRLAVALNRVAKEKAMTEASANIGFLRQQLAESQDESLRLVVGRLLESELQKLVVAKGREQFAFRVVDPAYPPARGYWPRPRILLAAGLVGGFMLALTIIFVRSVARRSGT